MFQCYRTYIKTYRNEKIVLIAISALLISILYIHIVLMTLANKAMIGNEVIFAFERWVSVAIPTICGAYSIYRAITAKELETLLFYPLRVSFFLFIYVAECYGIFFLNNIILFIVDSVYGRSNPYIFNNWISGSISNICVTFILAIILVMPDKIARLMWGIKKLLFIAWTLLCIKIGLISAESHDSTSIVVTVVYLILCLFSYCVINAKGNEFVAKICIIDKDESFKREKITIKNEAIVLTINSVKRIRKIESEIGLTYIKAIFDVIVLSVIYSRHNFCRIELWIQILIIFNILISTFSYKMFSMDKDYILIKDYYPIDKSEIIRKCLGALLIQSPYIVISNIIIAVIYKGLFDIKRVIEVCVLFLLINMLGVVIDYYNIDTRLDIKDTDRGEMNKVILLLIVGVICVGVGVL